MLCQLQQRLEDLLHLPQGCHLSILAASNRSHVTVPVTSLAATIQSSLVAFASNTTSRSDVARCGTWLPAVPAAPSLTAAGLCPSVTTYAAPSGLHDPTAWSPIVLARWRRDVMRFTSAAVQQLGPAAASALFLTTSVVCSARSASVIAGGAACGATYEAAAASADGASTTAFFAAADAVDRLRIDNLTVALRQDVDELQAAILGMPLSLTQVPQVHVEMACKTVLVLRAAANGTAAGASPPGTVAVTLDALQSGDVLLLAWPDVGELALPAPLPTATPAPEPPTAPFVFGTLHFAISGAVGGLVVLLLLAAAIKWVLDQRWHQQVAERANRWRRLRAEARTQALVTNVVQQVNKGVAASILADLTAAAAAVPNPLAVAPPSSATAASGAAPVAAEPPKVRRMVIDDSTGQARDVALPAAATKVVVESIVLAALDIGLSTAAASAQQKERMGFVPQTTRPAQRGKGPAGVPAAAKRGSVAFSFVSPMSASGAGSSGDEAVGASPIARRASIAPGAPAAVNRQALDAVVGVVAAEVASAVLTPELFDARHARVTQIIARGSITASKQQLLDLDAAVVIESPIEAYGEEVEIATVATPGHERVSISPTPAAHHRRASIALSRIEKASVARVGAVGKRQNAMAVSISQPQQAAVATPAGAPQAPLSRQERVNAIVDVAMQATAKGAGSQPSAGRQQQSPQPSQAAPLRRSIVERMVEASLSTGDKTADRAAEVTAQRSDPKASARKPGKRGGRWRLCGSRRSRSDFEDAALTLLDDALVAAAPSPAVKIARKSVLLTSSSSPAVAPTSPGAGVQRRARQTIARPSLAPGSALLGASTVSSFDSTRRVLHMDDVAAADGVVDFGRPVSSRLINASRRQSTVAGTARIGFESSSLRLASASRHGSTNFGRL